MGLLVCILMDVHAGGGPSLSCFLEGGLWLRFLFQPKSGGCCSR